VWNEEIRVEKSFWEPAVLLVLRSFFYGIRKISLFPFQVRMTKAFLGVGITV